MFGGWRGPGFRGNERGEYFQAIFARLSVDKDLYIPVTIRTVMFSQRREWTGEGCVLNCVFLLFDKQETRN